MFPYNFFLLLLLTSTSFCRAQEKQGVGFFSLYTGYGNQNFSWSIAGNIYGQNPNILSELQWKHLQGPMAGFNMEWHGKKKISLFLQADHSWIVSGRATDADYAGDNRTNQNYQVTRNSNGGRSVQAAAGGGYRFSVSRTSSLLLSAAGSFRQQIFFLKDPGAALNSRYRANVHSFQLQVRMEHTIATQFQLQESISFLVGGYRAVADWNLISSYQHPVSFAHFATSYGGDLQLRLYYGDKSWQPFAGIVFQYAATSQGTDVLYLADGQVFKSQFNGAQHRAQQLLTGVRLRFK